MKLLVVSNLYPPHHIGGYELGCRDVIEALRARGHDTYVLTSTYHPASDLTEESDVERALQLVLGPNDGRHRKIRECKVLVRTLRRYQPDVVYFWNQAGLSHWLPVIALAHGCGVAFFLSDTHFVSWRVGAFLARWGPATSRSLLARMIRPVLGETILVRGWPVIRNQTCHFASRFLRNCAERAGIAIAQETSLVAHWGIDLCRFTLAKERKWPAMQLLYVGQVIPQKGVHTAIAALALLSASPEFRSMTLSIAGGGLHPDYESQLREHTTKNGLCGRINFLGKIPRSELPKIYAQHDVLVFPSEWDEPFAITPLEAAAAGLAIIGTTTGGSGEFLVNRETALTFAPGDAADCARAIRELCADRELFEHIRRNALRQVTTGHTIEKMVGAIERSLRNIVEK